MDPKAESDRIKALRDLGVLDTATEPALDRMTALAADMFHAPMSVISLVDETRQWFMSRVGLEARQTPRSQAFCAHVLWLGPGAVMVVEDALQDPRFVNNPLVTGPPHIRFYAGAALTTAEGFNLGTLCVLDTQPRAAPDARALGHLQTLAAAVVDELEMIRAHRRDIEKTRLLELAESISGVGNWRYDPITGAVSWSEAMYVIHGVSPATFEPTLESSLEVYDETDRMQVVDLVTAAMSEKSGYEYQMRVRRPDGELRDVVCKAAVELDENGEVSSLYGVFQDVTEQARILRRLDRSRARYRMLTDNAADVITRIRLDGGSSYISPSIEKLLGYKPEDMVGQPAQAFVIAEDQPVIAAALGEMARGVDEKTVQLRAQHRDGHAIWVEARFKLLRDDQGQPTEMVTVIRNIEERKALEAETVAARDRAEEQANRALMAERIAGLGYWRVDAVNRAVTWSEQMYAIYGLEPGKPIDLDALARMNHPDDRGAGRARLEAAFATGAAQDRALTRIIRTDGALRFLESTYQIETDARGEISAIIGTVMDVTDRKTAEAALEASEARYRLLAENASDLITHSDMEGRLMYVSSSVEANTGYTTKELIGRRATDHVHPDDVPLILDAVRAQVATKGASPPRVVEYRLRRKDGRELWLESRPTLAIDAATGAMNGITDVIRDITERKAMEDQLREARAEAEAAAAAKGEFLANMSHELRTPLTAVLGFSRLAQEQPEISAKTRSMLERAVYAGKALLSTINDVLDFSKLEAGQVEISPIAMSPADMARNTLEIFALQAQAKGVALDAIGLDALPDTVMGDPDRLRQVLLNLIGNAVKFTSEGSVRLDASYAGGRLRFAVTDTGPGIAPEGLERLFQRFSQVDGSSTRQHGGTGLGLAICKGLVDAMGGQIGVGSTQGQGSCFWFETPAPQAGALEARPATNEDSVPAGARVLVVDDNTANRDLVRAYLAPFELALSEAADGEAAVAKAQGEAFDVILMDLRMPGIDGREAAARIRQGDGPNRHTPILAFSAQELGALGMEIFDGWIAKPIAASALIAALWQALDDPPARGADAAR